MNDANLVTITDDVIKSKIYSIRGQKVMLDRDLAFLYGVETRMLNQTVKRNLKRFPVDFMFVLTHDEMKDWKSQFVISNKEKMGLRKPPLAFTEHGVAMLSSVLNSDRAIMVNIQIIRIFSRLRKMIYENMIIRDELNQIIRKLANHDEKILLIFEYLKQLEQTKQQERVFKERKKIGFNRDKD